MESVSGSDVGMRRVRAVGLGHRARQDFVRGMHRHVALSRGFRHGTLLQSTVTGHCHWILPQDTVTGYQSQGTSHRILARSTDMGL